MFDAIAERYDLANHIISLGMHIFWKKKALREGRKFLKEDNVKLLDIACGTGDLLRYADEIFENLSLKVGLDPSFKMLQKACSRRSGGLLVRAKAEALPFTEGIFNLVTVSFGVRNFENRRRAFSEIFKVLKRGGIFIVLEFAKPDNGNLLQKLSWCYTRKIVPHLGGIVSGSRKPYEYLAESIERFPLPYDLTAEVEAAGFKTLKVERLFPPVTVLYVFKKP